jgi:hypothetical protein
VLIFKFPKQDAEAHRPEIVASAATITGMSTDKLAESLDTKVNHNFLIIVL